MMTELRTAPTESPVTGATPTAPRTEVVTTVSKTSRRFGRKIFASAPIERTCGIVLLALLTASFVIVPFFSQDPDALAGMPMQPPSGAHWFGTDWLGRDLFSRVFYAGRVDLLIVVTGVGVCVVLGTLIGMLVASAGKAVRAVMMRVIDAFIAVPFIVIVVVLVNVMGHQQWIPFVPPSVGALILSIAIVGWAGYARLTIGQALALREREHVVAARLLGYSRGRVLVRHVAPSVMGVNLSFAASAAVGTVGLVASLAFLGAGVQEPTPDLGAMMAGGLQLLPVAPWITIIPGMVVLLLGMSFALIADANRD